MERNQAALQERHESEENDARHSAHDSTRSRCSRKDREATIARIPNPDVVVQQLELHFGPPAGLAWSYQENPLSETDSWSTRTRRNLGWTKGKENEAAWKNTKGKTWKAPTHKFEIRTTISIQKSGKGTN
ncbi:hypothetical protein L3X38_042079 [Prunus dulcis]|uniref:Uncharacterized protein n=1 Tax=Prunus dulcis TaxID=3755 RepID=A0AAD4UU60_PRUDU|nr:hypothetical protein L3X38_042079 [Prunus dulcis]